MKNFKCVLNQKIYENYNIIQSPFYLTHFTSLINEGEEYRTSEDIVLERMKHMRGDNAISFITQQTQHGLLINKYK